MILKSKRKLIGGHRGSPKKEKENTIESFETAISEGADFIEFDVRRSKDGNLVIHHDAEISGIAIKTLKLSEINELSSQKGYEVPVLEDVLRTCVNRVMLDIEIKEPEVTNEAVKQILRYCSLDGFLITSFYDETLSTLNSRHPGIKKGLLFDSETNNDLQKRVEKLRPDLLLPHFSCFNITVLELSKKFNLRSIIWTVNNEAEMKKFLSDPFVAGIISDYPGIAAAIQKV